MANNQSSSLPIKTSPPPPLAAPSSTFGTQMEFLMDQQQFGERTAEREPSTADLMALGPILLQQLQQRQQQREDANNVNANATTQQMAAAIIQQAVQQQQQIQQQALAENSEPELAVV